MRHFLQQAKDNVLSAEETLKSAKDGLKDAKDILRKVKSGKFVVCPSCDGRGTSAKYVGCDCTNDKPYITISCTTCHGQGLLLEDSRGKYG
jgi:hypothetical protein